jgi:hypothetical protein
VTGAAVTDAAWIAGTRRDREGRGRMPENEHPKGALLFMLIYLGLLSLLWLNAYLRLWTR